MKNFSNHKVLSQILTNRNMEGPNFGRGTTAFEHDIEKIWLTVNRTCNFRCPYCYAETTDYKNEMPLSMAKKLVSFAKDMGAKSVILIGGEPLLYSKLEETVSYIVNNGMKVVVVTNGTEIRKKRIQDLIDDNKINSIGFSLKGWDAQSYLEQTKVNSFPQVTEAISVFAKSAVGGSYSFVITKQTHDKLRQVAELIKHDTKRKLKLIFCNPIVWKNGIIDGKEMLPVNELVESVIKQYDDINKILQGRLVLQQSLPSCVWPADFIEHLRALKQIQFGCNVCSQKGLAFGIQGEVLLCNAIADFPIAYFGKDFTDRQSFVAFVNGEDKKELFHKFFKYPFRQCGDCSKNEACLGGCPLKWLFYSAKDCRDLMRTKYE